MKMYRISPYLILKSNYGNNCDRVSNAITKKCDNCSVTMERAYKHFVYKLQVSKYIILCIILL